MGFDPKIHTALRITIDKLSSKKMSSLKLLAVFFFSVHQFITPCSIKVCGRLSTTSSLQSLPQETKIPLIGRKTQLELVEIKEKSK